MLQCVENRGNQDGSRNAFDIGNIEWTIKRLSVKWFTFVVILLENLIRWSYFAGCCRFKSRTKLEKRFVGSLTQDEINHFIVIVHPSIHENTISQVCDQISTSLHKSWFSQKHSRDFPRWGVTCWTATIEEHFKSIATKSEQSTVESCRRWESCPNGLPTDRFHPYYAVRVITNSSPLNSGSFDFSLFLSFRDICESIRDTIFCAVR
jgi:hypothetical protein